MTLRTPEQLLEMPSNLLLEGESRFSNIHFEPGIHPEKEELLKRYAQLKNGEVSQHMWRPEIATRMREYSPEVIAVDGAYPTLPFIEFGLWEKLLAWFSLPDRPLRINSEGRVYLVRGDVRYGDIAGTALLTGKETREIDEAIRQMDNLKAEQVELDLKGSNLEILGAASLGGSIGLLGASLYLRQECREKEVGEKVKNNEGANVSRKRFLKMLALGGGLTLAYSFIEATGRLYVPNRGAGVNNSAQKDMIARIIKFFAPKFKKPEIINGMTALLVAKEEDALLHLGKLGKTPGTVIMGVGHFPDAERFITNQSARIEAIARYTGHIVETFDEFASTYNLSREAVRHIVFSQLGMTEIVRVQDPGGSLKPDDIDNSIQLVSSFQSPQVEEAIRQYLT